MTICAQCGRRSDQAHPSGWYAITCGGNGQFDTSECLAEYARIHKLPSDAQWVRWK